MKRAIRKILVINSGSSSLKCQVLDMLNSACLAKFLVERIGCGGPKNHVIALRQVIRELGPLVQEIDAIGHRVVHGGEVFGDAVVANKTNMAKMHKLVKFAPLHMPSNLGCILICERMLKGLPNVAVFDTAFHVATMPEHAAMYAIDPKYRAKMGIRKYGFHGTSHKFVAQRAAESLCKPFEKLNLVTCHLGNGSSIAAIRNGCVMDTSMGLTPLAGMVMGTRCGDIDAAAVLTIMEAEGLTPREMSSVLNHQSGLFALAGSADCRDICEKASHGDKSARLALDMLSYRAAFYIGAYNTIIGGADAIVFTGGIGENSSEVREMIVSRIGALGIKIDKKVNVLVHGVDAVISAKDSKIPVLVLTTDEELMIAKETLSVLMHKRKENVMEVTR